jgi:hypothetical protein
VKLILENLYDHTSEDSLYAELLFGGELPQGLEEV